MRTIKTDLQIAGSPRPRRALAMTLCATALGFSALLGGCGLEPGPDNGNGSAPLSVGSSPGMGTAPDKTPLACVTETQGGPTSCKDEGTWKTYASMACAGKGLTLTKIDFSTSCGAGLYRQTTYECCPSMPPPPPPPPPPPGMCTTDVLKSARCQDDGSWKTQAEADCKMRGEILSKLELGTVCMGGHLDAKVECCPSMPPPPPPPPPTMCMWAPAPVMGPAACSQPDVWKKEGLAFCAKLGLELHDVKLDHACFAGGFASAQFECCKPTPTPPMCVTDTLTEMACLDDATWKTRAAADCAAKKLSLTDVKLDGSCRGGHHTAIVQCCSATPPPPPPPPMCEKDHLTSPMGTCESPADWKKSATDYCAAKKLVLSGFTPGKVCRGGFSDATVECCPVTPPPPPPPPTCSESPAPAGACKSPDEWKLAGDKFCAAKKESLAGLSLSKVCGMGGFAEATFRCCGATPPPPPPPVCIGLVEGDGKSCHTETDLKSAAERSCSSKMLKLTAFGAYDACMMSGTFTHAKYECCK